MIFFAPTSAVADVEAKNNVLKFAYVEAKNNVLKFSYFFNYILFFLMQYFFLLFCSLFEYLRFHSFILLFLF